MNSALYTITNPTQATVLMLAALAVAALAVIIASTMNVVPTKFTRKRKQADPSNRPRPNDMTVVLSAATNKLRVVCSEIISLSGIPQIAASGGAHVGTELPTAVTSVGPNTFDLTYAHNVASADDITIPTTDPAARGRTGSYLAALSAPVP